MKPRRWLLLLLLVPTLLMLGGSILWQSLDLSESLRLQSIEVLQEAGFHDVHITHIAPSFSGLEIQDIALREAEGRFAFSSSEALLKLSPLRWFLNRDNPLALVHLIELHHPKLTLDFGAFSSLSSPTSSDSSLATLMQFSWDQKIQHPEIRIRDAQIYVSSELATQQSEGTLLADRLSGLLTERDDQHYLLLQSQLLEGGSGGLMFRLIVDPLQESVAFTLDLDQLRIDHGLLPTEFALNSGYLISDLHGGGRFVKGQIDSLAGSGFLRVTSLSSKYWPDSFQAFAEVTLSPQGWAIEKAKIESPGLSLPFTATSDLLFRTSHLTLDSASVDLHALLLSQPKSPDSLTGHCLLNGDLDFQLGHPLQIEASLKSDMLEWGGRPIGFIDMRVSHEDQAMTLPLISWQMPNGELVSGTGFLRDKALHLDLDTSLRPANYVENVLHEDTRAELHFQPLFSWKDPEAFGVWLSLEGELLLADRGRVTLKGEFDREGGQVFLHDETGKTPFGEFQLRLSEGAPEWTAEIESLAPLFAFLKEEPQTAPPVEVQMEGLGRWASLQVKSEFLSKPLELSGQIAWLPGSIELNSDWLLHGHRGATLTGRLEALWQGQTLDIRRFVFMDQLEAIASINLSTQEFEIDLSADQLPLLSVWDLLSEDPPSFEPGYVNLWLAGKGPLDQVELLGGLELRQQLAGRPGRLRSELHVKDKRLYLNHGILNWDDQDLLNLHVEVRPFQQAATMTFNLLPQNLDTWLSRETVLWAGEMNATGVAHVDTDGTRLQLLADVQYPRLAGHSFDRFDLAISPHMNELYLDSLVLIRGGDSPLELRLHGRLPSKKYAMDLHCEAKGDFLAPLGVNGRGLPSTFFTKATGRGQIDLNFTGTFLDPQIREGHFELHGGEMRLASVFRHVRDLDCELTIANGRLHIDQCEGRVDRGRLRIRNRWGVLCDGEELENWNFEGLDLDCGVLTIESLDRHRKSGDVEATIPGLMHKDWDGRFALSGLLPGESLYFAGPADRPRLRGRVKSSHARFTFPFIKGTKTPTPLLRNILDFLQRIEWDISLDVGRNCNYYRKLQGFEDSPLFSRIKGFLDRITVDVFLEPTQTPLRLEGQIEDQSFHILGDALSKRGSIVFLEKDFEVEEFGLNFDASSMYPMVWGRAVHHLFDPSLGEMMSGLLSQDANQVYIQFLAEDEFGNRLTRGRWDEVRLELMEDPGSSGAGVLRGQEELLVEMGLDPHDPGRAFEEALPGMVAGFWEIPLQPIESRLRRELRLDVVRIFLPVLRNTAQELLTTQTRQSAVSQSYLSYLQGSRVILGKDIGNDMFATWTGQLMTATAVEEEDAVRFYQRYTLEYEFNRNLTLTTELVFDPLRENVHFRGDPRIMLSYRLKY